MAAFALAAAALPGALPVAGQTPGVKYEVLLDAGQDSVSDPAPSPDGNCIVLERSRAGEFLDLRTRRRTRSDVHPLRAAWSPSGDRIAFERRDEPGQPQIWTMPVDQAGCRPAGPARRVSLHGGRLPSYSPDGRSILYSEQRGDTGRIVLVPAAGGPARVLYRERGSIGHAEFTPDSRWIYFAHGGPGVPLRISRIPASGGTPRSVAQPLAAFAGLSTDGRYLAYFPTALPYAVDRATLIVADLEGREVARVRTPQYSYMPRWGSGHMLFYHQLDIPTGIHAFDLRTGAVRTLTPFGTGDRRPAYSPDGRTLAVWRRVGGRYRLALVPAAGGQARLLPTREDPEGVAPVWSPDGSRIGFLIAEPRRIMVIDVASGRETPLRTADIARLPFGPPFVWRRDGRAVLYTAPKGPSPRAASIREATLGGADRELRSFEVPAQRVGAGGLAVAFAGDSAVVLYWPGRVSVLPLAGGAARTIATPAPTRLFPGYVAVSPDGRWAAYAVPESEAPEHRELVTIAPLAGGPPRTLPFGLRCGTSLSWHPDSKHVLVSGYETCESRFEQYLLPVDGDPPRRLTADDPSVDFNGVSFSPDGRTLAVEAEQGWYTKIMRADLDGLLTRARTAAAPKK